ncbi:protein transport protein SEC31-like [Oryza glaberrima]|uniref:J domain-containing protein n=1 Tax=Oryza glaberrima TaxID=4538 RepID=I1QJG8_ORYGL|nr:protein transport protein SEC31-like [Oryza glaberrima]
MDPAAARRKAERWIGVAEKLLMARDLEGCKQFVSQARADDPTAPGADDLAAAADILLATQRRRLATGAPNPYAVLGLDCADPASRDPDVVHSAYRRLSLLLNRSHPDRPCLHAFADAARLVAEAWAFLFDPVRKASLDSSLDAAAAAAAPRPPPAPSPQKQQPQPQPRSPRPASPPPVPAAPEVASAVSTPPARPKRGRPPRAAKPQPTPERQQEAEVEAAATFWTACPSCCNLHEYTRSYEARTLLCPSCRKPFFAAAMATPPPIVPGTDMYYCSWGFFPMGFPGGPAFARPTSSSSSSPTKQAPAALGFYPMGPYSLPLPAQGDAAEGNAAVGSGDGTVTAPSPPPPPAAAAPLPVKPKLVKLGARKRGRPKSSKNKHVVIEIN